MVKNRTPLLVFICVSIAYLAGVITSGVWNTAPQLHQQQQHQQHQKILVDDFKPADINMCEAVHVSEHGRVTSTQTYSMIAVGDVSFARDIAEFGERHQSGDMGFVFDYVREIFSKADMALLNLESVLPSSPESKRNSDNKRGIVLSGHANGTGALVGLSPTTIVSMSHNHLLDMGAEAIHETVKALRDHSILTIGIEDETGGSGISPMALFERKNITFAFLSYCALGTCRIQRNGKTIGAKYFVHTDVEKTVTKLRPRVDVIVVAMHWGTEYYQTIDPHRQLQATFLSKLGVDVIIGHHPHVIQDHMMIGKRTFVAFSLGNFVFDSHVCRDANGGLTNESKQQSFGCRRMHPGRRDAMADATRATRIYRITMSKRGFESAQYMNGRIAEEIKSGKPIYRPQPVGSWIEACGSNDPHCHMCA